MFLFLILIYLLIINFFALILISPLYLLNLIFKLIKLYLNKRIKWSKRL